MGDNHTIQKIQDHGASCQKITLLEKPLFIWFSLHNANLKDGVNWKRVFTSANKN
ncbi:MAG: hypothetical protein IPP01_10705 [Saprospiraceae bacterium]|nr:hypothetical protein [Saprospiraceae bacterium]